MCKGDGKKHGTHLPQLIQHMTTRKPEPYESYETSALCLIWAHHIQITMQTMLISDQTLAYTAKKVLMRKQTI